MRRDPPWNEDEQRTVRQHFADLGGDSRVTTEALISSGDDDDDKEGIRAKILRLRHDKLKAEIAKMRRQKGRLEQDTEFQQMELERQKGTHVRLADIEQILARLGTRIRTAVESLQRKFGPEIADAMNEAIDDVRNEWKRSRFGGGCVAASGVDPAPAVDAAICAGGDHPADGTARGETVPS